MTALIIPANFRRSPATNRTLRALRLHDEKQFGADEADRRATERANLLEALSGNMADDYVRSEKNVVKLNVRKNNG